MLSKDQYKVLCDVERSGLYPFLIDYDESLSWGDIKDYIKTIEDETGEKTILSTTGKKALEEFRRQQRKDLFNLLALISSGIAIITSVIALIV